MASVLVAGAVGAGVYALWPNAPEHALKYVDNTAEELAPPPTGAAFSVHPDKGLPIRYAATGIASQRFDPIPVVFKRAAERHKNNIAFRIEKPGYKNNAPGEWVDTTWSEYYAQSRSFAKALVATGHKAYQSVAICGFNHPAWFASHCGVILACGLSAGTYTTNSPDACAFVASDSLAHVAVVDTAANAKKYWVKRAEIPTMKYIVIYNDAVPDELAASGMVLSFTDFLKLGDAVDDVTLDARTAEAKVENCVTLIYTSGTTGNPKAVMASHDAMLYSAAVVTDFIKFKIERMISYLPLSHIAAQLLDIFIPMFQCAESDVPLVMHFARPDVLKGSLPVTLQMVRPDVFFGVPRVWEKFCEGIKAKAKAAPATGVKKRLVDFAKDVGLRASYARQVGGDGYIPRGYNIAKTLVHAKVRDALGLDKCRLALTSAAPIQRETLEFLASLGIDVCETFGMSETCGMGTVSLPFRFKFGSCGWPKPTMEMKTDHVEGRDKPGEGEICFRGRHVMMGYLRNEEKSRETIDPEGWLHSGDVGRFDEDRQLYITGRIKELIIGAGGENIAPVPIEDVIKRNLPALSNVVMIGNNRKYNVVLVTLKCRPDLETGAFFPDLAAEALDVNPAVKTVAAAIADPTWQTYITKGIEAYNKIAVSNAQKIQKFAILPTDLSVPGGELTGTLKLKRNVVAEKYAAVIDGLYAGGDE